MFDIGGPELLVIILGAIILFGPKKIPEIMRSVGKGVSKIRAAQTQFKQQMNDIQSDLDPDAPDSNDSEFKVVNPNKLKKEHFEKNREHTEKDLKDDKEKDKNNEEEIDKEKNIDAENEESEKSKDPYNLDEPEKDDEKKEDKEKPENKDKSDDDKSN